MEIHINELEFEGDDRWTKQFNKCSRLFKENKMDEWYEERLKLELGMY